MKLMIAALLALTASTALACPQRNHKERYAFVKAHPCPTTGESRGACPGAVVDHRWPKCAKGPDKASNMAWSTLAESRAKDIEERALCRAIKAKQFPVYRSKPGLCAALAKSPQWPLLNAAICEMKK